MQLGLLVAISVTSVSCQNSLCRDFSDCVEIDLNKSHIHQPQFLSHTTSWQLCWKFALAIFSCLPCSMKILRTVNQFFSSALVWSIARTSYSCRKGLLCSLTGNKSGIVNCFQLPGLKDRHLKEYSYSSFPDLSRNYNGDARYRFKKPARWFLIHLFCFASSASASPPVSFDKGNPSRVTQAKRPRHGSTMSKINTSREPHALALA